MASRAVKGSAQGNNMAAKRIRKEIADLAKEDLGSIVLTPNESNILQWRATIPGPAGSPYEGGSFEVDIRIPETYPFAPPHLVFLTKVYHCNVASTGAICLDLLKTAWSPALSLYKVILSLSSLLTDPNPSDPLVPHIAQEYRRNRKKHDETAREWVRLYAMPKPSTLAPPAPPARTASSSSTASRRAIPRSLPASASPAPSSLAGTRRPNPFTDDSNGATSSRAIEIDDSDSDMEVTGETAGGSAHAQGTAGEAGPNTTRRTVKTRAAKRSRTNGDARGSDGTLGPAGPGADDVIVIDD